MCELKLWLAAALLLSTGCSSTPKKLDFTWPGGLPGGVPDAAAWLDANPRVRDAIVWEGSSGAVALPKWDRGMQDALFRAFVKAWRGEPSGLPDPPPNPVEYRDDQYIAASYLAERDAWNLYLSHVANGLAVEIGARVPWSVVSYADEQLAVLFDSRRMFSRGRNRYEIRSTVHDGRSVPAAADRAFLFMSGKIGATRRETIGNLLEWLRGAKHFMGQFYARNAEAHWQYRGFPPAVRIIEGTARTGDRLDPRVLPRTAGCHGTTGFIRSVLRSVNIPVGQVYAEGHSLPHFLTEGAYLSHGDDPYNALYRNEAYPGEDLLIDETTFTEWFGGEAKERLRNVGRRVYVLAVKRTSGYLVDLHRKDRATGRGHADSEVFKRLKRHFTLQELEEDGLWDRLDGK